MKEFIPHTYRFLERLAEIFTSTGKKPEVRVYYADSDSVYSDSPLPKLRFYDFRSAYPSFTTCKECNATGTPEGIRHEFTCSSADKTADDALKRDGRTMAETLLRIHRPGFTEQQLGHLADVVHLTIRNWPQAPVVKLPMSSIYGRVGERPHSYLIRLAKPNSEKTDAKEGIGYTGGTVEASERAYTAADAKTQVQVRCDQGQFGEHTQIVSIESDPAAPWATLGERWKATLENNATYGKGPVSQQAYTGTKEQEDLLSAMGTPSGMPGAPDEPTTKPWADSSDGLASPEAVTGRTTTEVD